MFAGLIGTILGGIALYYLPGILSYLSKRASNGLSNLASHLDREFPDGKASFKQDKKNG